MDVWCEAFCCRHIKTLEVFHSASEHAIFIQKPLLGAYGVNPWPLLQNPKYATGRERSKNSLVLIQSKSRL